MWRIRKVKTGSGKIAIQVVFRRNHRTEIIKHIGSAANKEEVRNLLELAEHYIIENSGTKSFLPEILGIQNKTPVLIENLKFLKTYHNFAYEFLSYLYELNGFDKLKNNLLKDLSIIRIIEPSSKLRSIELLNEHFGIKYTSNEMYKNLSTINELKPVIEKTAIDYARSKLNFDFSIVFYDVTTLYFETFKDDEFRKFGFSKDNKPHQPQILIALVVNREGYPIAVDMFEGNRFEGHTIIPVILNFKNVYGIDNLTIVADAAMLSLDNIEELKKQRLNYIVGARLSNLPDNILRKASEELNKKAGVYFKTKTQHGLLICDYSKKRAFKDKSDRERQIQKAKNQIQNPSKSIRRARFLKETSKTTYELNKELIQKDELLDGIKGYYTNLKDVEDDLIISRYKDLWNIEKSFRIAKSDLMIRPVYHYTKEKIQAHILIVFVSLCLSKSIELLTNLSIKKIKNMIWLIQEVEFIDKLTNKRFLKRIEREDNKIEKIFERIKKFH